MRCGCYVAVPASAPSRFSPWPLASETAPTTSWSLIFFAIFRCSTHKRSKTVFVTRRRRARSRAPGRGESRSLAPRRAMRIPSSARRRVTACDVTPKARELVRLVAKIVPVASQADPILVTLVIVRAG